MKKEQKQTDEIFDRINNLSMEQRKEIENLPYQIKERIDKLDERSREEIEKKITGLCNLDDATNFEKFPRTVREWLEKDIERILGITWKDLTSSVYGERFLSNTLRFFVFKLNTVIQL
ncbi:MAG: hypothetical protein AB1401_05535 [Thermodesulfobacteriota bacterium]